MGIGIKLGADEYFKFCQVPEEDVVLKMYIGIKKSFIATKIGYVDFGFDVSEIYSVLNFSYSEFIVVYFPPFMGPVGSYAIYANTKYINERFPDWIPKKIYDSLCNAKPDWCNVAY